MSQTSSKIWFDDPRASPMFGEMGEIIEGVWADSEQLVDRLILLAHKAVPPGQVFDIRKKIPGRFDTADRVGVAWYYNVEMQHRIDIYPLMERVPHSQAVLNPLGGYLVVARLQVPKLLAKKASNT